MDIQLWEVGAKRHFSDTSKSERTNTLTDRPMDGHMDGRTNQLKESSGPHKALAQTADASKILHTGDTNSLSVSIK